jgi:hypothetical protein
MEEKISHLAKGVDPLLGRAILNGVFEFGDDGMIELLQATPHVLFRQGLGAGPFQGTGEKCR